MRSYDLDKSWKALDLTEALTPVDNQPVDLYLFWHTVQGMSCAFFRAKTLSPTFTLVVWLWTEWH